MDDEIFRYREKRIGYRGCKLISAIAHVGLVDGNDDRCIKYFNQRARTVN